ncbi:probable pterin-4-alpha-carbinolamine dehydratase, chloroplastic [Ziziphus jujuba]|uniref:4a-hydroxytetrahydrobiopterin dehydratase n=1 Tax=Ziziphus jujuba TaxID=326968 RepID=A0A6P3ZGD9_ZIZJJ|nr:probable pterin-4-alpha-carbinolamine dehydratase, chloroplastic [Ziziphus jujuba]
MATTHLSYPFLFPNLSSPYKQRLPELFNVPTRSGLGLRLRRSRTQAMGAPDLLGDFGARDPFPAELESNFGEKVVGNGNTEHKILIPNLPALSLAQQQCQPLSPLQPPLSDDDIQSLLRKVVGWRLIDEEGGLKLQCLWKLRDYECGIELINRIYKVAASARHYPNLHLEQPNQVRAELWTSSIGGLSLNDFIVAAKIDEIKTSDLVPRKRIWA